MNLALMLTSLLLQIESLEVGQKDLQQENTNLKVGVYITRITMVAGGKNKMKIWGLGCNREGKMPKKTG